MPDAMADPLDPNPVHGAGDGSQASSPGSPVVPAGSATPSEPVTDFHIGDEFGTAKRNLPPLRIVLVAIAIVAIILAIIAFRERPKPEGAGAINLVTGVEVSGQNIVLAAITFTLRSNADKPLWVRSLKAQLTSADGHLYEDAAASAVDLDRYYQIFPALKDSSEPPISPETKLQPGTERRGTIVVSFPLSKEKFDRRKSLVVSIQPYDQALPILLK